MVIVTIVAFSTFLYYQKYLMIMILILAVTNNQRKYLPYALHEVRVIFVALQLRHVSPFLVLETSFQFPYSVPDVVDAYLFELNKTEESEELRKNKNGRKTLPLSCNLSTELS